VFGKEKAGVSIVVQIDKIVPPPDKHRMTRGQDDPDADFERVRPVLGRTQVAPGPIESAHPLRHLAVARKYALKVCWYIHTTANFGRLREFTTSGACRVEPGIRISRLQ
jgi:hypothetical protein